MGSFFDTHMYGLYVRVVRICLKSARLMIFYERSVLLTKALMCKARALFFEAKAFTAKAKTNAVKFGLKANA